MKGNVKWFNTKRGYGFIIAETGKEYFVHYSYINCEGFKNLKDGQAVTFDIDVDMTGKPYAVNVTAEE